MAIGMPQDRDDREDEPSARIVVHRWTRHARCVSPARHVLREEMHSWGLDELVDTAELVLSEVLTNAVKHARGPQDRLIETRYERVSNGVRLEVHDANDTRPVPRQASANDDSGRGLQLVEALTSGQWGVSDRKGVGKLVWAVVADASSSSGPEHSEG